MPAPTKSSIEERERLRASGLKRCSQCCAVKGFVEFQRNSRTWDGLIAYCKMCAAAGVASRAARNRARWASDDPYANPQPKKCARCKQYLPRPSFFTSLSTAEGLQGYCKSCDAAHDTAKREKRRSQWREPGANPYANQSLKRCGDCELDRPRSDFSTHPARADGLQHICRDCEAVRDAAKRGRRRAHWAAHDPYADPTPKHCRTCTRDRPRSDFYTHPSNADGLLGECKGCHIATVQSREARKRNQWVEHVDRDVLWKRDQGICYLCNLPASPDRWDIEHVRPISHGGEHSYANTAVSHPSCNYSKGGKPWPDVSWPEGDEILARLSA